ncbi:MAG: SAM-dependent methyltransferase [Planctomycetaceae bacterium]
MISELKNTIRDAVADETLHLVTLSRPRSKSENAPSKITLRPVSVRDNVCYQASKRIGAQEFHENLEPQQLESKLVDWITADFDQVNVFTSDADLEFRRKGKNERVRRSKPTHKAARTQQHNKQRQYIIPDGKPCAFLIATGVMAESGKVRSSKQKKFRQINRYLDIVSDIVKHLPEDRTVRIVDFGCGRSYLTFALYHLFANVLNRDAHIVGLDLKASVIADCQRLSEELNCTGLSFQQGDIANHETSEPVDLCVSLHACNTATDEAIAKAVGWQSKVILAVPCCHHELAGQLDNADQAPLLKHGILRERFAALATDSLRARALDALGYKAQVLEFVDTEHTPKNLMIRAIQRQRDADASTALEEYQRFRKSLGIQQFHLETVTGLSGS